MDTAPHSPAPRLIDGPDSAPATVLLAHGAGAPMDSLFMAAIAGGLAQLGWRVLRFEFPYMARQRSLGRRQGPDRLPVLQEAFRQQVRLEKTQQPGRPVFIGGKSMGGRVASLLVAVVHEPLEVEKPVLAEQPEDRRRAERGERDEEAPLVAVSTEGLVAEKPVMVPGRLELELLMFRAAQQREPERAPENAAMAGNLQLLLIGESELVLAG